MIKAKGNRCDDNFIDENGRKARVFRYVVDKVYLLTEEDIKKYEEYSSCDRSWWLRSTGEETGKILFVYDIGTIDKNGLNAWDYSLGVRPVIQISN